VADETPPAKVRCFVHPDAEVAEMMSAAAPRWVPTLYRYCVACLATYVQAHGEHRPDMGPDAWVVPAGIDCLAAAGENLE